MSAAELIERYLDGTLTDEERVAFEAELEHDPDLREQIALQQRIDETLSKLFAPGEPARLPEPAVAGRVLPGGRLLWYSAAAAVLLIATGFIWWATTPGTAAWQRLPEAMAKSPYEAYTEMTAGDFVPDYICEDNEQFRVVTGSRYRQELIVHPEVQPAGILGWNYDYPVMSRRTATVLARVDGVEVLLFMDLLDLDRTIEFETETGLHLHRRAFDSIVIYEISPFPEAMILPSLDRG